MSGHRDDGQPMTVHRPAHGRRLIPVAETSRVVRGILPLERSTVLRQVAGSVSWVAVAAALIAVKEVAAVGAWRAATTWYVPLRIDPPGSDSNGLSEAPSPRRAATDPINRHAPPSLRASAA